VDERTVVKKILMSFGNSKESSRKQVEVSKLSVRPFLLITGLLNFVYMFLMRETKLSGIPD